MQTVFSPEQVDCTTAVVLKILDNKCKMLPGEKAAVMVVYDVVKAQPGALLGEPVHQAIAQAQIHQHTQAQPMDAALMQRIHAHRVEAEALIPKSVMKAYKAVLRQGLFG